MGADLRDHFVGFRAREANGVNLAEQGRKQEFFAGESGPEMTLYW